MSRKLLVLGFVCVGLFLQSCGKKTQLSELHFPIGISSLEPHGALNGNASIDVEEALVQVHDALTRNLTRLEDEEYSAINEELSNMDLRVRALAKREEWIDDVRAKIGGDTVYLSDNALKVRCRDTLPIGLSEEDVLSRLAENYHDHYFELRLVGGKLQVLHAIARYKLRLLTADKMVEKVAQSLVFFVAGKSNGVSFTVPSTQVYSVFQDDDFYERVMKVDGIEDAIWSGASGLGWFDDAAEYYNGSAEQSFASIVDVYKAKHNCATQ